MADLAIDLFDEGGKVPATLLAMLMQAPLELCHRNGRIGDRTTDLHHGWHCALSAGGACAASRQNVCWKHTVL
eukprot:8661546-Alexandrium_andersonii.AAC.1